MSDLDRLFTRLDPATLNLYALMTRCVIVAEGAIRRRTRVRTGALRRSWTHQVQGTGEYGVVGTTLNYAVYQKNRPAQEGLADAEAEIVAMVQAAVMEWLRRAVQG
jgi:hypothetical protein